MSFVLTAAFDIAGMSRDADQIPSEPRTDKGKDDAPDDEDEGNEVGMADIPGVEAAWMT